MRRPTPTRPQPCVPASSPRRRVVALALALSAVVGLVASSIAFAVTPLARQSAATPAANDAGDRIASGPVRLTVAETIRGEEAVASVLAASDTNDSPREGLTYLLLRVSVHNRGDQDIVLDHGDFVLVGAAGSTSRFLGVEPPDPALGGVLAADATAEVWLAFALPTDEAAETLLYDSLTLSGTWADVHLSLTDAPESALAQAAAEPNQIGTDPAAPAALGEPIVTDAWRIEVIEVVTAAAVFDMVDFRTAALGLGDATGEDSDRSVWTAIRVRVDAVGQDGDLVHLPANAFAVVDAAGQPLLDLITLTPPRPDASGLYQPGAGREGWVAFDIPVDSGAVGLRFLPYAATTDDLDPRYLDLAFE